MNSERVREEIRVGISTCLLGQKVRYDGGHKRSRYITDILEDYFTFVPICPELEVGMGVPREPVHLEGKAPAPRMIGSKSGDDWTARMNAFARKRTAQLGRMGLSGFILKSKSPSCGMERVPVRNEKGQPERNGRGLFAAALIDGLPMLPVEEEGRLNDARLRENFIVRVFAFHALQQVFAGRFKRGAVVAFHSRQKLLLMAHSPRHYTELGRLVAGIKRIKPAEFRERYCALYMEALGLKTTVKKNVNVLQHILGYLKRDLSAEQKRDIIGVIEDYRAGLVPLVVPLTLMQHMVRIFRVEYILDQVYLDPHPKELMLRNHV